MNFDGGGENLTAERRRALVVGQGLQEELDCLTDVGKSLLDGLSLRLASLQFRAPGVTSVLVPFDYDTNIASHQPSFYRCPSALHRARLALGKTAIRSWFRVSDLMAASLQLHHDKLKIDHVYQHFISDFGCISKVDVLLCLSGRFR